MALADDLEKRIRSREARVGVLGLGYVGLPVATQFAQARFRVLGFDVDAAKVAALRAGDSYIQTVPVAELQAEKYAGRFEATDDFSRLPECDALLICVPTPLDRYRQPDLQFVRNTLGEIAPRLRKGQLVVLESTTYPGTTDTVLKSALEKGGLAAGRDFFLGYSPEREDPGNRDRTISKVPKVVGADDPASARAIQAHNRAVVPKVVAVSSTRAAEAAKILENVYRAVNIALVNEMKILFDRMGIDVWEVIGAASTKPFGFQPFYPGPGWGGPCIPADPFKLAWKAREYDRPTRFIELAGEVNVEMPRFVVGKIGDALSSHGKALRDARILLLGVSYKKDVDDPRESPLFPLAELLREKGALLSCHDPHVKRIPSMRHFPDLRLELVPLTPETIAAQDAVVIVTDHSSVDYAALVRHAKLVVDTRNATRDVKEGRERIVKA